MGDQRVVGAEWKGRSSVPVSSESRRADVGNQPTHWAQALGRLPQKSPARSLS